ncbi:putative GNAT family acetyltransferase [Actinoplanes octamycinicus]|uniref:Putative GNAT family acetyltransferase n=1 Tax=Actinoplanes octamycinicus TaxID=135948 RepID=A0A7W7H7W1_9ACTN|nr:GNAT family N-acetyltransferase [Actinoplanes octamycinicus]MBB4745569.1 putative GNAT family acetyltransferase [Actinoplanes octamycinicus]GIE56412.1 N-acetyltransferase [Actinoplanes octamycinicus]
MSDYPVQDNAGAHRFELLVDGAVAALASYRLRGPDVVTVLHTETHPDMRGRGLAGELARQTLDLIRSRDQRIIPACPFFAHYITEHPEYADLVAD